MYQVDCIIPAYNVGPYIAKAVESVMRQSLSFSKVRVILVDDGSSDDTEDVCIAVRRLFNDLGNIIYIRQEHQGTAAALNTGLEWAATHDEADFTCFLDGDDMYERTFMEAMCAFLQKQQVNAAFCAERNFESGSNLWPQYSRYINAGTRVYDLQNESFLARTVCNGMFRTKCLHATRFDLSSRYAYGLVFVSRILLQSSLVGFVSTTQYFKRKRHTRDSLRQLAGDDPTFCDDLTNACRAVYDEALTLHQSALQPIPEFIQNSVVYELVGYRTADVRPTATETSIAPSDSLLREMVAHTDNWVIEQTYIPYWLRQHLLIMKNGSPALRATDIIPCYYYGPYRSSEFISGTVSVMQIGEKNGRLNVRGFYIKPTYSDVELIAKVGDRTIVASEHDTYTNDRKYFLGKEYMRAKDFSFDIQLNNNCYVQFFFRLTSGKRYAANFRYEYGSRFYEGNRLFVGDQYIVSRGTSSNILKVMPITEEAIFDYVAAQNNIGDSPLYQSIISNFFEFRKRRIWLFMDRRTNIDDNAEALFRFAATKHDGIEKFYVVPDASYMPQFEGVGWTVIWNSVEFRLLLMFAEKFISSHTFEVSTTVWSSENETSVLRKFVNRFSNVDFVFLQHGITKENVSSWLNTYRHDISMLVTAAEREKEEFLEPHYGYGPGVVKLTGFPRYDRLTSHPQKMILFMPTFFKPYTTFKFDYSEKFKHSAFFHAMDDLINDPRLLESLKAHGYRFCFKLHEELTVQRDDFNIPDGVELVDKEITFNELFDKASLMITDYTSAVFDFAFLMKPVIYYQAVANIKYPDGYFDYERDGFGAVIKDQASVVDKVIAYIENGCVMEPEYVDRVRAFFRFDDRKNCQRVYAEISKLHRTEKG